MVCIRQAYSGYKYYVTSGQILHKMRPKGLSPFEGTGRQGSDLLTPGQKPAKLLKVLNPYLENQLCLACVQLSFT